MSLGKAPKEFEVLYQGASSAIRALFEEEGPRGFARGAGPRMLMHGVSCAISWGFYECAKKALGGSTVHSNLQPVANGGSH